MAVYVGLGGSDLFSFDNKAALDSNILYDNDVVSMTEYDEYVVYKKPHAAVQEDTSYEDGRVAHRVSHDDKEGADVLNNAFRRGQLVDYNVGPAFSLISQRGLCDLHVSTNTHGS